MKIGTTEEAIARFEESGARVVRATLHEPSGDRQAWFVGQCGWLYLASDEALIDAANRMLPAPLVHERGARLGIEWSDPPRLD